MDLNTPKGSFIRRLTYRLYVRGWRGFQVLGFKPEVMHDRQLRQIRQLAPHSNIGTFEILRQIGSGRSWYVTDDGTVTTAKSSQKLLRHVLTIEPDTFAYETESFEEPDDATYDSDTFEEPDDMA